MAGKKNKSRKAAKSQTGESPPYGSLVGLLTASAVTLLGVWQDIDPETILVRAATAAVIMAITTSVVTRTVSHLVPR